MEIHLQAPFEEMKDAGHLKTERVKTDMDDMEEYEKINEEPKSDGRFFKGVLLGALLSTALIAAAAFFILKGDLGKRMVVGGEEGETQERGTVLNENVQKKIAELMGYIQLYFYDEIDGEKLATGIYSGLLEGLGDKYTQYYTPQEYQDMQISATQNYCGIGAMLSQDRESMQVTITHIYDGAPAKEAGLRDGDVVVLVEDIEAVSMELSDLVTHIRGEEGTSVHLQIYRAGEPEYLEFDVKRANIDLPTVEHRMLDDKIGYIHILEFGEPTVEQFESAAEELLAQGMQGMILDVRDNPGGMLTSVTGILDDLLPEGTVVYTQDKYGKRQDYTSDADRKIVCPIAVLINGNSASASEILAGAIRDFDAGTLIGTKTYGKGVVQSIIQLEEGDAIKLTTAKYFTPKGENIHGTGISPDEEVKFEYLGEREDGYDELMDNQIRKGMEILEKEIPAQ